MEAKANFHALCIMNNSQSSTEGIDEGKYLPPTQHPLS
jgi:hypothetical protein